MGVLCLFRYALLCVHSSFAGERAGCISVIVFRMYYYYKCSVALSHGTVSWSAASFFCSGIQLNVLLSTYLWFISLLYLILIVMY